jgi:catechol 2,3-dioxygenase-like lactoylglutathione lyase family enzyme
MEVRAMIRGVHHVAVATGDLDRLVGFYRDLLGFEVVSQGAWEAGSAVIDGIVGLKDSAARTAVLKAGNLYLEVFVRARRELGGNRASGRSGRESSRRLRRSPPRLPF